MKSKVKLLYRQFTFDFISRKRLPHMNVCFSLSERQTTRTGTRANQGICLDLSIFLFPKDKANYRLVPPLLSPKNYRLAKNILFIGSCMGPVEYFTDPCPSFIALLRALLRFNLPLPWKEYFPPSVGFA